ncbi:OstA-like protein [Cytophaga hutchinsonii ATCC 33406]|nr:OstA-like protein [Cytophaga hutchinsonii ATCC 33406]
MITSMFLRISLIILLVMGFLNGGDCFAQTPSEKIELIQAGALMGSEGKEAYVKLKDHVIFKQGEMFLYCDSAFQYAKTNYVEAFGHVRLVQGDTLTMTCNKLEYDGNTKKAKAIGDVILIDKQTILKTTALNYDREGKNVSYFSGANISDKGNNLTSTIGVYNTGTKIFTFKKNVHITNPGQGFLLDADTLQYNSQSRLATFRGETKITTKDGVIKSKEGSYNTATSVMYFGGRAQVFSGDNTISGNKIDYDEKTKLGVVTGEVKIENKKDSITVLGQHAKYTGKNGYSIVSGNPLMYQVNNTDTLFLKADTLVSINDTIKKIKLLKAYYHVQLFRKDMQARCDSLVYNFYDSTIYLYTNPVLWNGENQLVADSIWMVQKNGKMHTMHMHVNAFVISKDTIDNFNQIKGRQITAFFANNHISKILVEGNAESIYHALEGEKKLMGVNKAEAGSIVVLFKDDKLSTITYVTKPDAAFIPPQELKPEDVKLKGFKWRIKERPTKETVIGTNLK